ncbi:MAG: SCP2 sterol-binding domain-containing protein [Deltaproteobacteria bacterium]|nr:SCP2 sterol-binding domain-containing protein [Deltaproteobacteria bacterium]
MEFLKPHVSSNPFGQPLRWDSSRNWEVMLSVPEVKVGKQELSGLGLILKQVMEETLQDPNTWKTIKKLKGNLVVREKESSVAVTISFNHGEVQIQNGAIDKPTAFVEGGFEELSEISSGQVGPIWALLRGKIKAGGNLLRLLKMSKVIINQKQ